MNDNLAEKERRAIENLRAFEPQSEPYYLCYSGGKDSDCIRILAELAGVKRDIVHNLTTVDAPETVYYVRSIPNVIIEKPEKSMWQLIPDKLMPPTRLVRYCCEERKRRYLPTNWETGEEVMRWWVGDDPRQITLEDMQ